MVHAKQNLTTKYSAFTLVELIVVIVILAILATIAFLSFGNQSSSARDSTRLSDLGSISKGLMVYQSIKGSYPSPDKGVKIYSSGTELGSQGEIGSSVKSNIKAGADGFVDPLDKVNYTYGINKTLNKYKLGAFLENKDSMAYMDGINSANAAYENRYLYLKGDNIAIIYYDTGGLSTPLQDTVLGTNGVSTTGSFDLAITNTGYLANVNNNSGSIIADAALISIYNPTRYIGCDTDDIALSNGQVWAACNAGATKVFSNETISYAGARTELINTWAGGLYQWGNSTDTSYASTSLDKITCTGKSTLNYTKFILQVGDLCNPSNNDVWGDITKTLEARKGPCAVGYHVPTITEWTEAISNTTDILSKLKIGKMGRKDGSSGNIEFGGSNGFYWTSTLGNDSGIQTNVSAKYIDINSSLGIRNIEDRRAYGMSVRCIKN